MTKSMLKFSLLGLMTLAVAGLQGRVEAQDTQKPPPEKMEGKEKKPGNVPFHGKLKAVDSTAKTITVGTLTVQITSETRISKTGNTPATLADAVVGEEVGGAYRKTDDGKLNATKVHFGSKDNGEGQAGHSHPKKTEAKPAQ
jgi:hypothetical protein